MSEKSFIENTFCGRYYKAYQVKNYESLMAYYFEGNKEDFCDELFCIMSGPRYFDDEYEGLTEEGLQLDKLLTDIIQSSKKRRYKRGKI